MATVTTTNMPLYLQSKEARFLYLVINLYESKTDSVKNIKKREKKEGGFP